MRSELSAKIALDALVSGILASGTKLVIDGSFHQEIGEYVEHRTLDAKSPEELVSTYAHPGNKLLDFGCGTGGHRPMLEGFGYEYYGVNYKEGMAADAAKVAEQSNDDRMLFYNGRDLPFDDGYFDIVYSFQTFEHVQDIDATFADIRRVLRCGGRLVGAVSYLEQVHDYSTYNFTPIGFKHSVEKAGLRLLKIYPRCDVFSFLMRRLLVVTSASDDNSLSGSLRPDNEIGVALAEYVCRRADIKSANLLRLMFSAHFSFDVERPW